jgi:hypothetical protein
MEFAYVVLDPCLCSWTLFVGFSARFKVHTFGRTLCNVNYKQGWCQSPVLIVMLWVW